MVAGWTGWARSQFFMVCWKRSTFPQVVGWLGREFFWTTFQARQLRARRRCGRRGVRAGQADGEDHAVVGERGGGDAVLTAVSRKVAITIGVVTRRWAVTCRA